jgi:hypothetical protein
MPSHQSEQERYFSLHLAEDPDPPPTLITLSISGVHFTSTYRTLCRSGYLRRLLRPSTLLLLRTNMSSDGTYFVDANPELFKHILQFLRRGTYPLFWSYSGGFDYGRYLELGEEARFLEVPELVEWVDGKKYSDAVEMRMWARESDDLVHEDVVVGGEETAVVQVWEGRAEQGIVPGLIVKTKTVFHPEVLVQRR